MKITRQDQKRLRFYLTEFYKRFPEEKFTIFHFVRAVKERIKDRKDLWQGICGATSSGKSLFAIMCQIIYGHSYDLTKNVTYIPTGEEIIEKFMQIKNGTLLIDEAAKNLRAIQFHDKQQQAVNTKAMTDRFKGNWVMMNMPNFMEFTKSMKQTNIRLRAIILYRTKLYARVVIQNRRRNWRSEDPWYDEHANKIYEKLEKKYKQIDNELLLKIERGLPNTIMDFIVPNLELILPKITNEYERLKTESRQIEKKADLAKKPDRYKKMYETLMSKVTKLLVSNELNLGKVKVTKGEISAALGVSTQTLNRYIYKKRQENKIIKRGGMEDGE